MRRLWWKNGEGCGRNLGCPLAPLGRQQRQQIDGDMIEAALLRRDHDRVPPVIGDATARFPLAHRRNTASDVARQLDGRFPKTDDGGEAGQGFGTGHDKTIQFVTASVNTLCHAGIVKFPGMANQSERLKFAMRKAGIDSAAELARRTGLPENTVRVHVAGTRNYPMSKAKAYGRVTGTEAIWLFSGDEPANRSGNMPIMPERANGNERLNRIEQAARLLAPLFQTPPQVAALAWELQQFLEGRLKDPTEPK